MKVPVTVKAKLTEKLRAKMLKEMEEGLSRAELGCSSSASRRSVSCRRRSRAS